MGSKYYHKMNCTNQICCFIKQQDVCVGFSHTITHDIRKVGWVVHVDALSVAHIQQCGVFYVKMETQQLLLNGESQCFHCQEKR